MKKIIATILFVSCDSYDTDGDGIPNTKEHEIGTDPTLSDSDADGLSDQDEVCCYITNPLSSDTDQDGDLDGFEVTYGLNPNDASSHGYTMGWPITPPWKKDALQVTPPEEVLRVGARMTRAHLLDPSGEVFDLYDYVESGLPTVIATDVAGDIDYHAEWVRGEGWDPSGTPEFWVRDQVLDGNLNYVVVLTEMSPTGEIEPPTLDVLQDYCDYDMPTFGCFADTSWDLSYRAEPIEGSDRRPARRTYLLDDQMIIRALVRVEDGSILGEALFDDFHAALAQELGIEVPTDP
jgi:hypothetical protein